MKQKLIISLIGLIACHLTASAQVIFTEDPYIFLNMDLEAKEKSALLTVETRSDRARMKSFPQMTITLMNDSVLILTGKNHNSSTKINSQDIICAKIDIASLVLGKSMVSTVFPVPDKYVSKSCSTGNVSKADKKLFIAVTVKVRKKVT